MNLARHDNFHLLPAFSLETLAGELAKEIAKRTDPFLPETVLVMNNAQRVWLQQFIARKNGICANVQFLSPEKFLSESANRSGENKNAQEVFARLPLAWRIFKQLKKDGEKTFPYRENRDEDFILLAGTLSDLFWHYQSFRPEMIAAWQRDDVEKFDRDVPAEFRQEYARQKKLWRALNLKNATPPALAYLDFLKNGVPENPPARLFVFAPTAIPRIHLQMLYKLSEQTEIFLYYHNLSQDLWTETVDEKRILREQRKRPQLESESNWLALVPGNELLTSWGKAARALAMQLVDDDFLDGANNLDAPPARDSALHKFQAAIRENTPFPQAQLQADGEKCDSLRIHIAHSPMREMEILREDLMELFCKEKSFTARDILVMLPDVETYAPFIRAAFEGSEIPFSIADKSGTENFHSIAAFLAILKIAQSEIRLSEMLDLLTAPALLRGLKIEEKDVPALREILIDSNVRWGLDADFRSKKIFEKNVPALSENFQRFLHNHSWNFALQRCALGYIAGTPEIFRFGKTEVVPVENFSENDSELIGKFSRLLNALRKLCAMFENQKKSVPQWCDFLQAEILDSLFEFADEEKNEEAALRHALEALRESATLAELDNTEDVVNLKTAITPLENQAWEAAHNQGMLRGRVTFCQLQPLRNIPAQAIYIAGMSNGAFPHSARKTSFDLIANAPKSLAPQLARWDRTARDEDCLLLFEAVLAAKNYLRFSYVGKSQADNAEIPPCTPLAKLIEHVPASAIFHHRLHARDEDAFAQARTGTPTVPEKTLSGRAPFLYAENFQLSPKEQEKLLPATLENLCAFYAEPAKFVCEKRLRIFKKRAGETISDDEPQDEKTRARKPHEKTRARKLHEHAMDCLLETLCSERAGESFEKKSSEFFSSFAEKARAGGDVSALAEIKAIANAAQKEIKDLPLAQKIFSGTPLQQLPGVPECERLFRHRHDDELIAVIFANDTEADTEADRYATTRLFFTALALSERFPKEVFTLYLFAPTAKKIRALSSHELKNYPLSIKDWQARFERDLVAPPFLFSKIPQTIPEDSENIAEAFYEKVKSAWEDSPFGNNMPAECEKIYNQFFYGSDIAFWRERIINETLPLIAEQTALIAATSERIKATFKKSKK